MNLTMTKMADGSASKMEMAPKIASREIDIFESTEQFCSQFER